MSVHSQPFLAIGLALSITVNLVALSSLHDEQNARKQAVAAEQRSTEAMREEAVRQHEAAEGARLEIRRLEGEVAALRGAKADAEARAKTLSTRLDAQQRASRSRRVVQAPSEPSEAVSGSLGERAHAWASTPKARSVSNCESGGNPRAVNPSGKYRGKWQMDSSFWRTYGGLSFASRPDAASEYEQDIVAYKGWLARGWQPWSCA